MDRKDIVESIKKSLKDRIIDLTQGGLEAGDLNGDDVRDICLEEIAKLE